MRICFYLILMNLCVSVLPAQTIYGLKSRSTNQGGTNEYLTPVTLYSFEDDGTQFTSINPVTKNAAEIRADGLACSPIQGLWCFEPTSTEDCTLYQLDPNTAAVISTGIVFEDRQIFGAAFDRADRLWAIDQTDDELLQIDLAAGSILRQVPLTLEGDPFDLEFASGDICFNTAGQAFLVYSNRIYYLDVHTGILIEYYLDTTSSKLLVGAAIPNDRQDTLIAFEVSMTSTDNDDIFLYDLLTPSPPTYLFKRILNNYNAGRGDLAAEIPADLIVETTFDSDADGWTGAGLSPADLSQVTQSLTITYSSGFIGIEDNDSEWTVFVAPSTYLGDKSAWLGGEISLDIRHETTGTRVESPAVFLVSGGTVLCSPWVLPSDLWEPFSVSLTPAGWHTMTPDGPEPSLSLMHSVLSNIEAMYIIGDYVSGTETTWIDNVRMMSGLSVDSSKDGFVNLEDFTRFAAQWLQNTCSADDWCARQDFNKSGTVNMSDFEYLILSWHQKVH